ncbi:MAG: amino acid--[acyl-carrier-protein] ligase [bacterium]|nr:amino acid--[acyl-carrier-protein] ligase [Deltaproteobacteria bacterium]MCP4907619.1 amino acid--[acyl-carrier-protein] ligase [bacterium]
MISTRKELADLLVDHGFWIPAGVPGLWGRTDRFEAIVRGFDGLIVEIARESGAERIEFPPVVSRDVIRQTGYMESFPELCGSIHSYREHCGRHLDLIDRVEEGGDWSPFLEQMELTLCPAACYPLYPAATGVLPEGGRCFDLSSYVFRAEPSDDPARMQAFRQRENVCMAGPEAVSDWRDEWSDRGLDLLRGLDLPATRVVAGDPFFGRGGKMLVANQIAQKLKFEVVVPVTSSEEPTAVCSFNYHEDKFGSAFDIRTSDGSIAHTACVGFGLERVTLALIATHGPKVAAWPAAVREALSL